MDRDADKRMDCGTGSDQFHLLAVLGQLGSVGNLLRWNYGLEPIVVESDALGVVQMINSATKVSADIGLIIEDIRDRLQDMSGSRVVFAYRNANVVAHNLSKMALTIVEDLFWMESYPPCVERFVQDDCPD
ncbi:hypothetical protein Dsin_029728 [Dipteronia sinensis]|uniref:RNase H type-1 domain-containing protein n=1 Tax=Dipteronia sinensis TaxID=43782 RepID=A0AAE0DWZ9_9ROSI|nr:hypothetical protein Dsin_029728 [Dipteronia sinensis]